MPKVSEEFLLARREEILDACAKLYENMSFKDITLKEIGKITSFNRTAIYNYFNSKEEIFLALMQREYECWSAEVDGLVQDHEQMTRDEIAQALSHLLEKHERLLKLLSMNHFDLEENSRYENLVEFKKAYGESIRAVARCLDKVLPGDERTGQGRGPLCIFPLHVRHLSLCGGYREAGKGHGGCRSRFRVPFNL